MGRVGVRAVGRVLPRLIDRHAIDLVVANGENTAGGAGVDPAAARELFVAGVHVLTSGNHVWRKSGSTSFLEEEERALRPANFPSGSPGRGWTVATTAGGVAVGVVNLIGQVFMGPADSPFACIEGVLRSWVGKVRVILVDMHAEATSEKAAMAHFLDGQVAAVVGSHTHVQTADERLLPGGTAFLTDLGMCGPVHSVVGIRPELSVKRFRTGLPTPFEVGSGAVWVQGAVVDVDESTGRARDIQRVREVVE